MTAQGALTFTKAERVCSRTLVEKLFGGGGSRSAAAFPLRAVWMHVHREAGEPSAQLLVSVPKRCFKRAVKRNRVKRQVREAWRKHKHVLHEAMASRPDEKLVMALIWIDHRLCDTARVERRVAILMERIGEHP